MEYRESHISAHHNYLVNGMLVQGFVVGDQRSHNGFFLLGDIVLPGETGPRISARLMDEEAHLLLEFDGNRIRENPERCNIETTLNGYRIVCPSGDALIEVRTEAFANGYLTLIKARLFDEHGRLRVETRDESIWVHGGEYPPLTAPISEARSIRSE
ncbi:MAG: hypothetical protein JRJ70_14365 [Deltaproteobacteria bacterium]|nr:hypothetical protein [Deltaproteobacteria bacterium]